MTTRQEIYAAIQRADKAGDSDSVRKLGAYLSSMPPDVAPPAPIDPTADMTTTQKVLAGAGKAFVDLGRGAGQMARSVMPDSAADAIGLPTQADIDESRKLDAPLMNTTEGTVGNVIGNVAATLPTVFIPGAAGLRGAMAVGGATGALQPVATGESRLKNTAIGAGVGGASVVAGRVANAAWKGGKALVEPLTTKGQQRIAARTAERFGVTQQAVAGLTDAPTITGARPTLAEAIPDPQAASGAARLQDAIRIADPEAAAALEARMVENNAARVGTLQGLAGEGGARAAAQEARSNASKQLYEEAFKNQGALSPSQLKAQTNLLKSGRIDKLLESPAIKQAQQAAQTNAQNSGKTFSGAGSIEGLHNMKLAIDDMIKDPATAAQQVKVQSLRHAQDRLLDVIETLSPGYKTARQTHAALSKPVNQMDVAGEVLRKGTSATGDLAGNARLMPDALARSVRDEGQLIKAATGRSLPQKTLADLLEPEQLAKLNAVVGETDKLAAVGRAANGPGSATAQRMSSQNVLRQVLGPLGLPESWAESTMLQTAMRPVQFAYSGVAEPRIQAVLSELALNPARAQQILAQAQRNPRMLPQAVQDALPYIEQAMRSSAPALAMTADRRE